jgi:hypothetical protein
VERKLCCFRMGLTLLQARPTAEGNPKPLPMAKALSLEPKYITQNLGLILSLAEQATVRLLRSRPPARLTGPPAFQPHFLSAPPIPGHARKKARELGLMLGWR